MHRSVRVVVVSFLLSFPLLFGLVDAADSQAAHYSDQRSVVDRIIDRIANRQLPEPNVIFRPVYDQDIEDYYYGAVLELPESLSAFEATEITTTVSIEGLPPIPWTYDDPITVSAGADLFIAQTRPGYWGREHTISAPVEDDLHHTRIGIVDTEDDVSLAKDRTVRLYDPVSDSTISAFRFQVSGAVPAGASVKNAWLSLPLEQALPQETVVDAQVLIDAPMPLSSVVQHEAPAGERLTFDADRSPTISDTLLTAVDGLNIGATTIDVLLDALSGSVLMSDQGLSDQRQGAELHVVYTDPTSSVLSEPEAVLIARSSTSGGTSDRTRQSDQWQGAREEGVDTSTSSLPLSDDASSRLAKVQGTQTVTSASKSPHTNPSPPADIAYGEIAGRFSVNALGGGNYTIPIPLPYAPGGLTPELSLNYSSTAGEGLAGTGWSLNGLSSIRRCTQSYAVDDQKVRVQHDSNDQYCLDGQRLVNEGGALYRTMNDNFKKIERITGGGDNGWEVTATDGTVYTYGLTRFDLSASNNGRIEGVDVNGNAGAVHVWALSSAKDLNDNNFRVVYFEDSDTTQYYPIEFRYGSLAGTQIRVKFQYHDHHLHWPQYRHDTYAHGFKFSNSRRLKVIQVERGNQVALHNYFFDYDINPQFAQWQLTKLRYCMPTSCLPAKTFAWTERTHGLVSANNQPAQSGVWSAPSSSTTKLITGDFNGDGRTDVIRPQKSTCLSQGNQFSCNNQSPHITNANPNATVADFNGDGMDDYVVRDTQGTWRTCRSVLSGTGGHSFSCAVSTNFGATELKVGDFDGDGISDLYREAPHGIYFGTHTGGFQYSTLSIKENGTDVGNFEQSLVMDVNGDGASDIVGLTKHNPRWLSCTEATGTLTEQGVNALSCQSEAGNGLPVNGFNSGDPFDIKPGDFNADGRQDLVFYNRNNQTWHVFYSNGHENAARFTEDASIAGFGGDEDNHLVVDLNGDGRTDVVRWQNSSNYQVAFSAAGHFHVVPNIQYATLVSLSGKLSDKLQVGDFDSDGRQDLAHGVANQVGIHLSSEDSAPLLHQVKRQRPGNTQTTLNITYSYTTHAPTSASVYPNKSVYNTHIVRASEVPGNRPNTFDETTYDYDKLMVNKQGLGVLGFNSRAETDERRKLKRHYLYHDKYPFVGRINQMVTTSEHNGSKLQEVKWYTYTARGSNNYSFTTDPEPTSSAYNLAPPQPLPDRYWVYTDEQTTHRHDYHTNAHVSTTVDDYTYTFDGNGRSLDYGKAHIHQRTTTDHVNNRNWVETTTNLYQNQPTPNYLMGLKTRSTVKLDSNGPGSGSAVPKVRDYRYDAKGQVHKVIIEPDVAQNRHEYLRTEYYYDIYGNVKEEKSFGNTFGYQALPVRVTTTTTSYPLSGQQSVGNTTLSRPVKREVITNAEGQSMTIESDLDHGQPLVVKDINDLVTRYEYDAYGQKPKVIAPDNTYTHVAEHDWVSSNDSNAPAYAQFYKKTVFKHTNGSEQQKPLTEYFDAHGNLLKTYQHRWHTSSKPVIVDYTYDQLNRLTRETTPYYQGQGKRSTVRTYVGHTNHVLKLTDHRGPVQDYAYNRYTVTRTDSDGHKHIEKRNAMDQVILTENGDPSNLNQMTYQYDDAGRVRHIYDQDNHRTTRYYDSRDNLMALIDPDRGRLDYRYDSYGAMVWQRNARNQVTRFFYDKLGRLIQQNASDYLETRTYDTASGKGAGQLASVAYRKPGQAVHHRQTLSYDGLGRLSQNTECLGAESQGCSDYTTTYGYDAFSRLQLTTLPGGKPVYREYNNNILQRLRRGQGGSLIWQMNNMDARGRPYTEVSGNGTIARYTYSYAAGQGGQLSSMRVQKFGANLMHRKYLYDGDNAQLASREDVEFNQLESFTYDKQRRVKTNQVKVNGTQTGFYTYDYDDLGNIIDKPDHPDTVNQTYTYGQGITVNGAGPHAIKSLGSRTFTYDASGNLLNDGEREARWKTFEKPYMLRKGSATIWLEFGIGNNRIRRRQGNFNTWYLDGGPDVQIERLTHNNNNNVTTKYHYRANGKVVAIDEETSSGTTSRYLHGERLGSASLLTDAGGAVVERMSYDIWGQVRALTSGSNTTILKSQYHTKSYTGHEALADVDLVHMNGRVYDPILGRFMSADPFVQYAYNSQSYNRYSYVLNNPLGATDPTGYFSDSVDGAPDRNRVQRAWDSFTSWLSGGSDPGIGNESGLNGSSGNDLGIPETTGIDRVYEFFYNATGYTPSDEFVNAAAAIGDNLTGDLSAEVREYLGIENVDVNSPEFIAVAAALTIGTGPKGVAQKSVKTLLSKVRKKRGGCSFDGSMEVLTDEGYIAIDQLPVGSTTVLAKDEITGEKHWKPVIAHLWNEYEHTVYIDLVDVESQERQTIISNKIHPFFVQRVGYLSPLTMQVSLPAGEHHLYTGPIEHGHWIQAGELQTGDRLLSASDSWVDIEAVRISDEPLLAHNLDVAEIDSFFVRGAAANDTDGVWVHNCDPEIPNNSNSSPNALKLEKQLASEEQIGQLTSGGGTVISQPAKQANRIAEATGRNPADIQKVSSDARVARDGTRIETHSFRDASTNELIEPKTIIGY